MNNSLLNKGRWFWQKIKPRGRLGFVSIFLLAGVGLIALFVAGVHPAYAGIGDDLSIWFGNLFLGIAAKFMAVTVFVLRFVIEIASYNHYINAPAVQLGWVLVRDVTNMFFVLILMLIAFGTVLGIEQYEWKKLLVKFVLAAILVNFSRLICGVMIDAAQVFMMTFISGVAATAGGNLVNALHMNDILAFSNTTSPEALSDTMNIVVAGLMSFVFASVALIVIGAYLFMLIARVIALWILIILSPLAFVLGVVPKFQSYATQWWTEFTNNVLSGPVLAFFLWLAFAVAGGANIHDEFSGDNASYQIGDVQTEAAAMAEAAGDDTGTNANMILDWENLANFILAAALMIAGVKTTQKLSAAGAGMLGSAAGAATKFAMAATGVTAGMAAAKWAGRTAASGAKAVALAPAKYVGKKAQAVGLAIQAGAYSKADQWNRFIEHRGASGGTAGVGGWFQRRLMIGGTGAEIETRKKKVEAAKTRFGTSIVEKESLKQSIADIETETELGMGFKEKKKAERREFGFQKAREKVIAPNDFWGEGQEKKFGDLAAEAAAKAESINEKIAEDKSIEVGKARDKRENVNIYENAARAKIQKKKMEELYSPMSYPQLMQHGKKLSEDYEAKKRLASKEVDPKKKEKIEAEMKEINAKRSMALTAAHLKSAGQAKDASAIVYGSIAGESGHPSTVSADNLGQLQAHYLSMWLGRYVDSSESELKKALGELKVNDGSDHNALMAQRTAAMTQAAAGGHVNMAGLFELGKDGYDLSKEKYWQGERRYAINSARGKTDGFKGVLDQKFYNEKDENGEWKHDYVLESEDAINNVVGLHSGMSKLGVDRMRQTDVDTWEHIVKGSKKENLEKLFDRLSDVSDETAVNRLVDRIVDKDAQDTAREIIVKIREKRSSKGGKKETGKDGGGKASTEEDEADYEESP